MYGYRFLITSPFSHLIVFKALELQIRNIITQLRNAASMWFDFLETMSPLANAVPNPSIKKTNKIKILGLSAELRVERYMKRVHSD